MAALAEEMKGPIHALTLDVKGPDGTARKVDVTAVRIADDIPTKLSWNARSLSLVVG